MSRKKTRWTILILQNAQFILLALVILIFSLLSPRFLTYKNFENVVTQASYIGIVGVGMTFVLLTGGVDLSVGSTMYLSAAITGVFLLGNGLPLWLAITGTLLVGALVGLLNALAVTLLRIVPFIVTLGSLALMRGLGLSITQSADVTFPSSITDLGSQRLFGLVPLPIVIFALVALIATLILRRTAFGKQIYAVGSDVEGAKKAGVNTTFILASVYVICGVCAALGGLVSVAQFGVANAGFGKNEEFNAIAVAVLGGTSLFGGRGSVFPGTVLGAILVQLVTSGLIFTRVDIYLQPLVYALIIFGAVLLDSLRTIQIQRLERRTIRAESTP
jgi:ribose transport system permease protein